METIANIQVLYQDSALLVINKPAGLATLPDGYDPSLPHIKSLLEGSMGRLWIVHRLDKETSGALVLARSAEAHRALNTQFEQHQVSKVYHALVMGTPEWDETTVELPLHPNGDRQHRTVVDWLHGKPAITHLRVLGHHAGYALVEAIPETGRTHQIRAHLSTLGLVIVGDKLYRQKSTTAETEKNPSFEANRKSLNIVGSGMGLHARSLTILHPTNGNMLTFIAPYPDSWTMVLQHFPLSDLDM